MIWYVDFSCLSSNGFLSFLLALEKCLMTLMLSVLLFTFDSEMTLFMFGIKMSTTVFALGMLTTQQSTLHSCSFRDDDKQTYIVDSVSDINFHDFCLSEP